MPNPTTNFRDSSGSDFGNILITKEYLMSVYPQIANQLITPELWTWGNNTSGGIGDNTTTQRNSPVTTLAGGSNWKQVACGFYHTAAIKTDGTLWTWGSATDVQLGTNDTTNRLTPVTTFAGGTNWKQVSCGYRHTAAVKTDGTLWTWGLNANGQLGNNNTTLTRTSTPITTFAGGTNWKQVSCGLGASSPSTAAIKTDATLWTWGDNQFGQLGDNTTTQRNTPITTFAGGTNWKQVSCGYSHMAAIKTDGTIWTWGRNNAGQLGINLGLGNDRATPVTTFSGGTNWKQVGSGGFHTVAIKTDGTLWIWGNGGNGSLGTNSTSNSNTPVTTFSGGTNWKQTSSGRNHSTAIKTDGTLWNWGQGTNGQLGNNNSGSNILSPVTTFAGGTNWKQVSANGYFTAAIRTSDDLQGI